MLCKKCAHTSIPINSCTSLQLLTRRSGHRYSGGKFTIRQGREDAGHPAETKAEGDGWTSDLGAQSDQAVDASADAAPHAIQDEIGQRQSPTQRGLGGAGRGGITLLGRGRGGANVLRQVAVAVIEEERLPPGHPLDEVGRE